MVSSTSSVAGTTAGPQSFSPAMSSSYSSVPGSARVSHRTRGIRALVARSRKSRRDAETIAAPPASPRSNPSSRTRTSDSTRSPRRSHSPLSMGPPSSKHPMHLVHEHAIPRRLELLAQPPSNSHTPSHHPASSPAPTRPSP
ncbi:hypothetical protein ACN28S_59685 [Cystobacter fuscus]